MANQRRRKALDRSPGLTDKHYDELQSHDIVIHINFWCQLLYVLPSSFLPPNDRKLNNHITWPRSCAQPASFQLAQELVAFEGDSLVLGTT
jgi:hypothetical protein